MPSVEEALQYAWKIHQQGQSQSAESIYRQVIAVVPHHPSAWCFLGIALHDQKRYPEAIAAYRESIRLQPSFPIAFNNLGNTLRYVYQAEESDRCFLEAIRLKPDYVNAYKNRGTLHVWNGNLQTALESYSKAMELCPADAELHRNLGVLNLLQGNFERGWEEYRWRWKCPDAIQHNYSQPRWSGEPLQNKTILLYAEQGLGDTLHFIRFAKVLQQQGAKVLVHGPAALTALLSKQDGFDQWIPQTLPIESSFDYHCSLVDVADILQVNLNSIPAQVPYVFPAVYLVSYWRDYFNSLPPAKMRIGLAWQGNRDHQADQFRSFPLSVLEPLGNLPDVQLVSLQHGYGREQSKNWHGACPIIEMPDSVDQSSGAFMDTAAIMCQLDLIITTDTSTAHLAGSLGRPAFVLLNLVPDWRWLLKRDDSPWYPSLRLFRQTEQGNWVGVVKQVYDVLQDRS